jgi:hypothetical protein
MSPRPVPEYDESRWVLKALRETAHELEAQLYGLREKDLRWRPSDDALSLKEIAAHLRDGEEHFLECVELIVQRSETIPCFDADALLFERDYRNCNVHEAAERFEYLRYRSVSVLWSLDDEDWALSARHPYLGDVSVLQLARERSQHDLEHLWAARRLHDELVAATPSRR